MERLQQFTKRRRRLKYKMKFAVKQQGMTNCSEKIRARKYDPLMLGVYILRVCNKYLNQSADSSTANTDFVNQIYLNKIYQNQKLPSRCPNQESTENVSEKVNSPVLEDTV